MWLYCKAQRAMEMFEATVTVQALRWKSHGALVMSPSNCEVASWSLFIFHHQIDFTPGHCCRLPARWRWDRKPGDHHPCGTVARRQRPALPRGRYRLTVFGAAAGCGGLATSRSCFTQDMSTIAQCCTIVAPLLFGGLLTPAHLATIVTGRLLPSFSLTPRSQYCRIR